MRTFKGFLGGFVAIFAVMLSAHVMLSGQTPPQAPSADQRMVLIETVIHPDSVSEFEAAEKLRCAAIVKGGGRSCHVYSTAMFGPLFTYYTLVPLDNYAHYDDGNYYIKGTTTEEREAINKRLGNATVSSAESSILLIGALSMMDENQSRLLRLTEIQVRPGTHENFSDDVAKFLLPAAKKAGMTEYITYRTLLGNSPGRMFTVAPLGKFAELDSPSKMSAAMSKEEMATFNQHISTYVEKVSYSIIEYRKELSVDKAAK
jgi:hypothetical protein